MIPASLSVPMTSAPGFSLATTIGTKGSRRPLASYDSGGNGGPASGSLGKATGPGLAVAAAGGTGAPEAGGGLGGEPPQPLVTSARASQPATVDLAVQVAWSTRVVVIVVLQEPAEQVAERRRRGCR